MEKQLELKKAVEQAGKAMLLLPATATLEQLTVARNNYLQAQQAMQEYEDSLVTPEQKAAKARLEQLQGEMTKLMADLAAAKQTCINLGVTPAKGEHTSNKLTYDDCQDIRRMKSCESTVKEIAAKYGISEGVVNYKVNYLQGKLRRGDEAFTPLVNAYYPLGAPYAEDNVKETASRYKVKAWTKEHVLTDIAAGLPVADIAAKYEVPAYQIEALQAPAKQAKK